MKTLFSSLKELNLSEPEAKLYTTLLHTGPISVRDLAMEANIKRTTTYLYIDQLIEKGLVIKIVKGSQKQVAANPPSNLQTLVEAQYNSAQTAMNDFSHILALLSTKMATAMESEEMEIRYFKGSSGIYKVYLDALQGKEFRLYVRLSKLKSLLMPNELGLDYDLFERGIQKNKNLKIYELISDAPGSVEEFKLDQTTNKGRYYYKYMPEKIGLDTPGILMFDNNVAIISGTDVPHMYVLHNKEYFESSIRLFDYIWDTLPGAKKEDLA